MLIVIWIKHENLDFVDMKKIAVESNGSKSKEERDNTHKITEQQSKKYPLNPAPRWLAGRMND